MIKNLRIPDWRKFHTIIFDFDGVFTNNKVYVDEKGNESIRCDRGDGLAFDILRKFIKKNNLELRYFILSKEKNVVVSKRSKKLGVPCYQGIDNKETFIKHYLIKRFDNLIDAKKGVIYIGNDLNDLSSILFCGFSIAPSDAHQLIKDNADIVLEKNGGDGFVREIIESIINIEKMTLEELQEFL